MTAPAPRRAPLSPLPIPAWGDTTVYRGERPIVAPQPMPAWGPPAVGVVDLIEAPSDYTLLPGDTVYVYERIL